MSSTGMPSVMQTMTLMPAAAASRIASAAHVDDRSVGAGALHGVGNGVEDRQVDMGGATLARGHAANNLGAVLDHLSGVEGALLAGEALHDHLGVLIDQN
jgi:hypothetical protein